MVDASRPPAYASGVEPRPDDSRGAPAAARQDDAVTAVSSVAYGFMGSQALFAALEIGLFTELAAGPASAAELALRLGLEPRPLLVLLEACAATELLERDGDRYRNTAAASRYLVRRARGYMGDYYLRQIAATLYAQVPAAARVIRGHAAGVTYAGFLDDPARTEEFIRGQHAGSSGPAYLLARSHDLSGFTRLLDLGGGSGAFSIEIARRHGLTATVVDHPSVVSVARKIVAEAGLAERIRCVPGDAIAGPWPEGADLILLSYVVSSYGPDMLQDVLARAGAYLPPGGGLIVHDFALHEGQPGPRNAALWYFANLAISATTYPHTVESITRAMSAAGFVGVTARPHVPDITFVFMGRRAG
jgi:2-hydroxy-4-(methylsulfanyl)butanoate S-methyltransferase